MKSTLSKTGMLLAALLMVAQVSVGQMRSGKLGVGVTGIGGILSGNRSQYNMDYGFGLALSYSATEYLSIRSLLAIQRMGWKDATYGGSSSVDMGSLNFYAAFDMMPQSTFNVFLLGGAGYAVFDPHHYDGTQYGGAGSTYRDINYMFGGGGDYFLSEFWSVSAQGEYVLTGKKAYDGYGSTSNNTFMRFGLQVRYYFFDQDFISKLLKAQADRYEKGRK